MSNLPDPKFFDKSMPAQDILEWLDLYREDPSRVLTFITTDAVIARNCMVRLHKSDELEEPQTSSKTSAAPKFLVYKKECSYVNLTKLLILEETNKVLHDL